MNQDVLVLTSSTRPQSSTARLGALLVSELSAYGHRPALVHAGQLRLPFCTGADQGSEAVDAWRRQARSYRVHLWVASEWHASVPGSLKNALDHLAEDDLRGAGVGLVAQSGGSLPPLSTISHLRAIAQQFGTWLLPTSIAVTVDQIGPPLGRSATVRLGRLAADIGNAPCRWGDDDVPHEHERALPLSTAS